jgi:hypothetical protein
MLRFVIEGDKIKDLEIIEIEKAANTRCEMEHRCS